MKAKLIDEHDQRVFAVIFDTGEDPVAGLTRFAEEQNLNASSFTAIGAFSEATLGYFDWQAKDYERIPASATAAHAGGTCWPQGCGQPWKSSSPSPRATWSENTTPTAGCR